MIGEPLENLGPQVLQLGSHLDLHVASTNGHDHVNRPIPMARLLASVHDLGGLEQFRNSAGESVLLIEAHGLHQAHAGDVLHLAEPDVFAAKLVDDGAHRLQPGSGLETERARQPVGNHAHGFVVLRAHLLQHRQVFD